MADQECVICIFNTKDIPGLTFNEQGVCEYCMQYLEFDRQYPNKNLGLRKLEDIFLRIHEDGKGKNYDCVVGLSGGQDSSYVLHLAKSFGLRPLAVNYDNGFDTEIAKHNIAVMCSRLQIPLMTFRPEKEEVVDVWKAFLLSGAPDVEAPTDLALTKCLYEACDKHDIKYILNGHSFRTEGWVPKGMSYMDGRYVKDVHDRFGTVPLKTFPQLSLWDMIKYSLIKRIKRVRPLYYVNYDPTQARVELQEQYNWKPYGGKHLENKFTAWFGTYYRPLKSNFDSRIVHLAALVRVGITNKIAAKRSLEYGLKEVYKAYASFIENELGISHERMIELANSPEVSVSEFKTYRRHFKLLKPLFFVAYRMGLIPKTFYVKYVK